MAELSDMIWIEYRKAVRSKMPLWTALASMFLPLAIAFLLFVSRNPQISAKLGLISAKANLTAFAGADWTSYLSFIGLLLAAGGFILFVLAISWTFGREFADGTVKDLLAVPVQRGSILLAKFVVVSVWSLMLTGIIFAVSLLMGALIGLPGGSVAVILHGSGTLLLTALLAILTVLPFAFLASAGRGYLLPVGIAILALMMANLVNIIGWADLYPWAIPGLFAEGKEALAPTSLWIVVLTGLFGILITYGWWKTADQNR